MKTVIIIKGKELSTIDGVFIKTTEALSTISNALKKGLAKKIVDSEDVLMYHIN